MESIKDDCINTIENFFKKLTGKDANIYVNEVREEPCPHCGYGEEVRGIAILEPTAEDTVEEILSYKYWSGCMTYDEELSIEEDS